MAHKLRDTERRADGASGHCCNNQYFIVLATGQLVGWAWLVWCCLHRSVCCNSAWQQDNVLAVILVAERYLTELRTAAGILSKAEEAALLAAGPSGSSPRRGGGEGLPLAASGTGSLTGTSLGPTATTPGPRSSTLKPFQSTVASLPEAAGLPYDENYAYLCLLRRYVIYGPQLGLASAPPVGSTGRQTGMSMTGAALAAAGGQDALLSTSTSGVFA